MIILDNVRLPRLLRLNSAKTGLEEVKRLYPSKLSVELNADPISHAEMILTEEETEVQLHDFVEIFGQNGSLGIFRVASMDYNFTKEQHVRLNHALDTLYDVSMALNTNISGNIASVLSAICAAQTTRFWTVGTVQDSGSYEKEDGGNALDILKEIAEREDEYYLTYDFSTFPWKINFLKKNSDVLSEFRLSRNLEDIQVTYDDKDLCTRLYLEVETPASGDEGGTDKNYEVYNDTAAQEVWGVISKTETVQAAAVNKQQWVQKYFDMHHNPSIQISISGLELNRLTGETIDQMHLSRICRVVMPEYGAPILERIVSISYPDLLRQPTRVRVALANKRKLASDRVKEMNSRQNSLEKSEKKTKEKAEKTEKKAEKNKKEISNNKTSLIEQDKIITDQGELLRKAGIEIDPSGVFMFAKREGALGSEMASIDVRADQITSKVEKNRSDADEGFSEIKQRADRIDMDVVNLSQNTASHFEITDNKISAITENVNINATNIRANAQNISTHAGILDTHAAAIRTNAGLIETNAYAIQTNATAIQTNADLIQTNAKRIDVNAGSINVNAKNIKIIADDYVTINKLNTEIAKVNAAIIDGFVSNSASIVDLRAGTFHVSGNAYSHHTISVDGKQVATFLGSADVNFNRAAAVQEGKDSVTLSSSGWESGGRCIVKASNGKTYTVSMPGGFSYTGGTTWDSSHKTTVQFTSRYVGQPLVTATIDASSQYSAGQRAGSAAVTISASDIEDTGSRTWTADKTGVYVGVRATASNGKTNTNSILVDTSTSYNQGKSDVTISVNGNGSMISGTTVTVNFKATASNGKSATGSSSVSVDSLCQSYRAMGRADYWNGHWERPSATNGWTAVIPGETSGTTTWFSMKDVMPDADISIRNPAQGYIVADVTICGKYYSKTIQISQ